MSFLDVAGDACPRCHGTGYTPGTNRPCTTCDGQGTRPEVRA